MARSISLLLEIKFLHASDPFFLFIPRSSEKYILIQIRKLRSREIKLPINYNL